MSADGMTAAGGKGPIEGEREINGVLERLRRRGSGSAALDWQGATRTGASTAQA